MAKTRKTISARKTFTLILACAVFVSVVLMPTSLPNSSPALVYADSIPAGCPGGPAGPKAPGTKCPDLFKSKAAATAHCKSNQNAVKITSGTDKGKWYCADKPKPSPSPSPSPGSPTGCNPSGCDLIANYVNPAINLLSALFGLIAVASIIMGGIQYAASEGDPQKAANAKNRIYSTIIAIFAYLFLYAFLQFLVPGGFLHG